MATDRFGPAPGRDSNRLAVAPSIPWLGRLPGDIVIERENFRFYFPVVTCIVISLLLTLVVWLVRFFSKLTKVRLMPMSRVSAGLLMYRILDGTVQVLLAHSGGPFMAMDGKA